jgi:hypothetical protein
MSRAGTPGSGREAMEKAFSSDFSSVRTHGSGLDEHGNDHQDHGTGLESHGKLGSVAFTDGKKIHLAPGEDRLIAHELTHVVQQR